MCFKRSRDGTLSAYADGHAVGAVKSQSLCSALFDLYLGDEPVSVDARTLAANRVLNMVTDHQEEGTTSRASVPKKRASILHSLI